MLAQDETGFRFALSSYMNLHGKKMIASIVLVLISSVSILVKGLLISVPLALAGVMIGVTVSRIKEIRSGEEDDLSQY